MKEEYTTLSEVPRRNDLGRFAKIIRPDEEIIVRYQLYGTQIDFRESEEFLERMGELPTEDDSLRPYHHIQYPPN
jgi:hypothetical protein